MSPNPQNKTPQERKAVIAEEINALNQAINNLLNNQQSAEVKKTDPGKPPPKTTTKIEPLVLELITNTKHLLSAYTKQNHNYLLSLATVQNQRRQHDEELSHQIKYQSVDLAKKIIPILDHFDRALDVKNDNPELKSFLTGFKIIYGLLIKALHEERIEVMEINVGDKFNHNLHHALAVEDNTPIKPDHITKVLSKGYQLSERIIRHPQVVVAKKADPKNIKTNQTSKKTH